MGADLRDCICNELDVRARERGIIFIGEQYALAADAIIRSELSAQFGIGDLQFEMLARDLFRIIDQHPVAHKPQYADLVRAVQPAPEQ